MSTSIPIPPPRAGTDPPAAGLSPSNASSLPRFSTSPLSINSLARPPTDLFPSISPEPEPDDAMQPPTAAAAAMALPARPASFAPFFTLIADATEANRTASPADSDPLSMSMYHPARIHYVFSDDDTEALIDACVRASQKWRRAGEGEDSLAMEEEEEEEISSRSGLEGEREGGAERGKRGGRRSAEGGRRTLSDTEERVILIDMAASGDAVIRAQSLSEKWQVTNCEVGKAPIWEEGKEGEGEEKGMISGGGGLMLRIEGTGIWRDEEVVGLGLVDAGLETGAGGMFGRGKGRGKGEEEDGGDGMGIGMGIGMGGEVDMEKLLEGFDRKMGVLRKVLGGVGWAANEDVGGNEEGGVGEDGTVTIRGVGEDAVVDLESEKEEEKEKEREVIEPIVR